MTALVTVIHITKGDHSVVIIVSVVNGVTCGVGMTALVTVTQTIYVCPRGCSTADIA